MYLCVWAGIRYVYKVVCVLKLNIKYFQMFPNNTALCFEKNIITFKKTIHLMSSTEVFQGGEETDLA